MTTPIKPTPTQEEWALDEDNPLYVIGPDGHDIATTDVPQRDVEANKAHARKIVAVPKMLTALMRAEFLLRRISEGDHQALTNAEDAAEHCRKTIIEATGEEPTIAA